MTVCDSRCLNLRIHQLHISKAQCWDSVRALHFFLHRVVPVVYKSIVNQFSFGIILGSTINLG